MSTVSQEKLTSQINDGEYFRELPINQIMRWERNPRKTFHEQTLQELADSITEDGVQQPIVVRLIDQHHPKPVYQIVMGERRYRASKMAARTSIPAIVRVGMDDRTAMRLAVVENCQREDLNPIEAAEGYQVLIDVGFTQEEVADEVGISRSAVANAVRLLKLPFTVKEMVRHGALQATHARHLLRFVAFPDVLTAMAEHAIARNAPASSLESGVPFDGAMEDRGVIRWLGRAHFNRDQCKSCPLGAYFPGSNYAGWCFLPKEFEAKNTAIAEERQRKEAEQLEQQVQKSAKLTQRLEAAGVDLTGLVGQPVESEGQEAQPEKTVAAAITQKLPRLQDLPGAEALKRHQIPPECTEKCPCRVLALDYNGTICEACKQPGRLNSLKGKETREKKKEARKTLAEAVGALQQVETMPLSDRQPYHSRTLAHILWNLLIRPAAMEDLRKSIRPWKEIEDPDVVRVLSTNSYELRNNEAVEILARLPIAAQLQLAMEVLASIKAAESIEMARTTCETIDYLLGRTTEYPKLDGAALAAQSVPDYSAEQEAAEENTADEASDEFDLDAIHCEDCEEVIPPALLHGAVRIENREKQTEIRRFQSGVVVFKRDGHQYHFCATCSPDLQICRACGCNKALYCGQAPHICTWTEPDLCSDCADKKREANAIPGRKTCIQCGILPRMDDDSQFCKECDPSMPTSAVTGGDLETEIAERETCDRCNGTGRSPTDRFMLCGKCNGVGKILEEGLCRGCGCQRAQEGKMFCAGCDPDTADVIGSDLPELAVL